MQNRSANIAILFFTRSAETEAHYKQFTHDPQHYKNTQIADHLIEHTLCQIKETGLPYFVFDERQQIGSTFGERITNAFCTIFDKGFDHVIAVGNDIPQISKKHILKAAQKLKAENSDIVLGPDTDGGTWLMGYSRNAFKANLFEQLPWTKSGLLDAIFEQADDTLNIALLRTLSDIDNPHALTIFVKKSFFDASLLRLIHQLTSILSTCCRKQSTQHFVPLPFLLFQNILLRAPPAR